MMGNGQRGSWEDELQKSEEMAAVIPSDDGRRLRQLLSENQPSPIDGINIGAAKLLSHPQMKALTFKLKGVPTVSS